MDWATRADLPEHPLVWRRVFDPRHTAWSGASDDREKVDALHVLFLNNPHFRRNGLSVIREYMEWCDACDGSDYKLSAVTKAKRFLEARIERARERWYEDKEAGGATKHNTADECVVNSFRAAICHLDALAKWQGFAMRLLEEEPIQVLRDRICRAQNTARAAPRDYAASSRFLTKRLTQEEMEAITECWWDGRAAERIATTAAGRERAQVRGLLFHCLSKSIGRRGQDIRNLRNAMLFLHRLPRVSPVKSCWVVGASLRHVKEYSENVEHLIGWARSKDRMACPIGALACYFVWLNDIAGVPLLDEIRRDLRRGGDERPWWKRMLFVTNTREDANENPMSYATHYKAIHAGYNATGIVGMTTATHGYRYTLACDELESGASFLDVGVFQGWYHDNAADVYLRGAFKSAILLRACGWEEGHDGYACWWEGQDSDVPESLRASVFPGLDGLLAEAQTSYTATRQDRSAVEFLKVLQYLRRVFLEDAVHKRPQFPDFPAYARHPLFHGAEWPEYAEAEERRISQREKEGLASPEQERLSELVRTVVTDALHGWTPTPIESRRPRGRRPPSPLASNAPIELPPPPTHELPEIPDPVCLYTCYQIWQQHRAYFYATAQPPWKKRFGDRAATMKLRYSRMRPFLMYLDKCGASARRVIDALEAFRKERKVTASVFIKQCFYHLEHPLQPGCKKPPRIQPEEMRARMERESLPMYEGGGFTFVM